MLSIRVEAHYEEEWLGKHPSLSDFLGGQKPLRHQWLTYNAEGSLIVNSYNTGTGKTKAAFLRLLKRYQDKNGNLDSGEDNVLLIAPTNELLAQHAEDAKKFCQQNNLPYRVLPLSREKLDELQNRPGFSEEHVRRGYALHAVLRNPRKFDGDRTNKATIFVINPDIFYYAFYFLYNRFDRIPLFQDILTLCNFIIIDEFHYYNPKQLANFLFFMHLSREYGHIHGSPKRQFCLLTATPDERVSTYLSKLGFTTDTIDPRSVAADTSGDTTGMTRNVSALAPVHLDVYGVDELKGGEAEGLIALVDQKRGEIAQRLNDGENGAIISSSLWCIQQIYKRLSPYFGERMGRITGPESSEGRKDASWKMLILATPTVDIGYNFEKGENTRQNIDFLFYDARSGDEFIQRLGRAGRVLGKKQQDIPSHVSVVVTSGFYKALQDALSLTKSQVNGRLPLSRATLRQLAEEALPKRNDLYVYLESGAIVEAFLPLYRLRTMEQTEEEQRIRDLFESLRQLFHEQSTLEYEKLRGKIYNFLQQDQCYSRYQLFPKEKLELLERVIVRKESHPDTWLTPFADRLGNKIKQLKKENNSLTASERFGWILSDLRDYFIEKARFSFREAFQPPLALINDPRRLHTSEPFVLDDVLRIVRFYEATYFASYQEWEAKTGLTAPEKAKDAVIFCNLKDLREPDAQLQIGLKLNAHDQLRGPWQEVFAYRMTALYGLKIAPLNDNRGLPLEIQELLSEQFIPVLVVAQESKSAVALWSLQKKAQFIPYKLAVTFADDLVNYWAVLGTMALQVQAEMDKNILQCDRHRVAREDDAPIFC